MQFRIKVRNKSGNTWWEDYDKQVGQSNFISGIGWHPVFNGDIKEFGRDIVAWYNQTRLSPDDPEREFIEAEFRDKVE